MTQRSPLLDVLDIPQTRESGEKTHPRMVSHRQASTRVVFRQQHMPHIRQTKIIKCFLLAECKFRPHLRSRRCRLPFGGWGTIKVILSVREPLLHEWLPRDFHEKGHVGATRAISRHNFAKVMSVPEPLGECFHIERLQFRRNRDGSQRFFHKFSSCRCFRVSVPEMSSSPEVCMQHLGADPMSTAFFRQQHGNGGTANRKR